MSIYIERLGFMENTEEKTMEEINAFDANLSRPSEEESPLIPEDVNIEDNSLTFPISYEYAEESVIGMVMRDSNLASWIIQSGVDREHFQKKKNKHLYPIVRAVRLKYGTCSFDLVCAAAEQEKIGGTDVSVLKFIGGEKYISKCYDAPSELSIEMAEATVDEVLKMYKLAESKRLAKDIEKMDYFDANKLTSYLLKLQNKLTSAKIKKGGLTPFGDLLIDAHTRYWDRANNPEKYKGINTGYYWLDKHCAVSPGKTTVLAAKTNYGKTVFVGNWMSNMIMSGINVLFYTLEVDKATFADRMICGQASIHADDWKGAKVSKNIFRDRYDVYQHKLVSSAYDKLYVDDSGVQNAVSIIQSVKLHMLIHPVDVVVIDYIQKLRFKSDNIRVEITDAVNDLSAFAKDNNIAVILVSQFRRTKEVYPILDDLKESGAIEQFSDCVVFLHRSSTTHQQEREDACYMIAKNRNGQNTEWCELKFREYYLRFDEDKSSIPIQDTSEEGKAWLANENAITNESTVMENIRSYDENHGANEG